MILRTLVLVAAAALGTPAVAQIQPGSPPGGGAPPTDLPTDNRGMGAVTDVPNQHSDLRTAAEDALARQGDARASLVRSGQSKAQRQAQAYRAAIERYVARTDEDRIAALAASRAPSGDDASAKAIRTALEKDLALWGKTFGFDQATMADQRTQWLTEPAPMTAADWALRRAGWFAARDAWIAEQRAWAAEQAARSD
ncbi:hypothetical protein [Tsuneonella sp. SYSU-LHT278]|uniref:hypothetical protein n=1 Tax=Tsuneonella sediminis TaxID=3416089 RepID=UPI003F7B02EF